MCILEAHWRHLEFNFGCRDDYRQTQPEAAPSVVPPAKCALRRYVNLEAQALAGQGRDPVPRHITARVPSVEDGRIVCSSDRRSNYVPAALPTGKPWSAPPALSRALRGARTRAVGQAPSLAGEVVSPHGIRHTTATHLSRTGWTGTRFGTSLGHAMLAPTNSSAEIDVETKTKAIARCDESESATTERWRDQQELTQRLPTL